MAEAGGTSTQAGIRYQNSVAALHVGHMLDTRARSLRDSVTIGRVEARRMPSLFLATYDLWSGDPSFDGLIERLASDAPSLGRGGPTTTSRCPARDRRGCTCRWAALH